MWGDDDDIQCWPVTANGDFVAHAREDLPSLIAYVKELEAALAAARKEG